MAATLFRLGGWRSVAALVLAAAAVTGIGQTGAGHSLLEKAGLIQQPTGYTALAFGQPSQPLSIKPAGKKGKKARYKLSFSIQNAGTASRAYRWTLLLVRHPGHADRIAAQPVSVGPGKMVSIHQAGNITCGRAAQVEFIVQLTGSRPAEAIHARATCPRSGG
jgi:hypothetical protein